ncbi:hypothetical protein LEQ06_13660 [Paraclostridium sp. AKS46]|nr:hypothetical protein [Paraclostridium sp. AKS46]
MNIMDDKMKELKRDLINDIIESEKNPFEKELEVVLEKTLEIAKKLGFKIKNIDEDVGYAEYGMGDEYIFVINGESGIKNIKCYLKKINRL